MRKLLEDLGDEKRHSFIGIFERKGLKSGYKGPIETILLLHIKTAETGKEVADHLWFNLTKGFERAHLKHGDKVKFNARVSYYEKGYKGYRDDFELYAEHPIEIDCRLSYPTKIQKINESIK
jgi:hypothetical protein